MKAIKIEKVGGPEVMKVQDVALPEVGPTQVLVKIKASGINFIDVYQRKGIYKVSLPYVLGLEGAGVVEALGAEVTEFAIGDRVAYTGVAGSYAEYVLAPWDRLVSLPQEVDFKAGAASMLQGMTAHYLTQTTYPLKAGESCLVHAAAGGVGLLLIQMAKRCGARVIGTVSTTEKAAVAKKAGADEVVIYSDEDFEVAVKNFTAGKGVSVVYDSVGRDTFDKSLNCLTRMGYMVLYGQASGPVPPLDPQVLNAKGSLFLTRPSLFHHIADRESLVRRASEVLSWVASGELRLTTKHQYPLSEAAQAHRDLEGRKSTGKVLLIP